MPSEFNSFEGIFIYILICIAIDINLVLYLLDMKIRFLKNLSIDVEDPRLSESFTKSVRKWSEIRVTEIYQTNEASSSFKTYDGEFILRVPNNAFERLPDSKPEILLT